MSTQIKIDVDNSIPPKGYIFTGEYRSITNGESFINVEGEVFDWIMNEPTKCPYPVLRKIKPEKGFDV